MDQPQPASGPTARCCAARSGPPSPTPLIWDTDALGKPDVLQLAHDAYVEAGAEAVICISNRPVTWQVVHGLEQRGIPAFGPIWDS